MSNKLKFTKFTRKRKLVKKQLRQKVKPVLEPAEVKPEVVKLKVQPHEVLHIDTPRDCTPVVAKHPDNGFVFAALPKKKKKTLMQWLFGE